MATNTQQKQELFKAIWATAGDLLNSADGRDYKSCVSGIPADLSDLSDPSAKGGLS